MEGIGAAGVAEIDGTGERGPGSAAMRSGLLVSAPSEEPAPRAGFDLDRLSNAVREILLAIGEDPDREGLVETPARVARSYAELFAGLGDTPVVHLERTFEQPSGDPVALAGIEFTSICEHHLLPVFGVAGVAYLPANGRVVGLSKLARTVDAYARRPQLQERMTAQIADAVMRHLSPQGVVVSIEAEHMCLRMRGVRQRGATMRTVASRGLFERDAQRRRELLDLVVGGQRIDSPVEEGRDEISASAFDTAAPCTPWRRSNPTRS